MKNSEQKEKISYREAFRRNFRAVKLLYRVEPKAFWATAAASVFAALIPYVAVFLSARIIGELAGGRDPAVLRRLVLLALGSAAVLALASAALTRWKTCELEVLWQSGKKIYMNKLLDMDFQDIDRQHTYDLLSQILGNENWSGLGIQTSIIALETGLDGVTRIAGGLALSVSLFAARVPQSAGALAFLNSPLCTAAVLLLMLGVTVMEPAFANRGIAYWARTAEDARFGNRIFSFFGIAAFQRERAVDMRMYRQQDICSDCFLNDITFTTKSRQAAYLRGPIGLWTAAAEAVSRIVTALAYLYVCLKSWCGAFGVGMVTQYIGAITGLFQGVSTLLQAASTFKRNAIFLQPVYELLDTPNSMYQGSLTTEKRSDRQYEVEFRDVSFQYPGSETYALRHVNMKFKVGSRLAVVGMNGSGKTTFIKLLCRLYDPTEGQILLNGIDIRKYRYDDYINVFSVVFQDFQLLSLPLGENVAGSARYDQARALDSLKKAGFEDRLAAMPKGLDTCLYKDLDKEGVDVSGGEAQKIAIARALYKDAPFIILDEPTAALDPIAEAEIYSKFNDIAGDKTAIYISHRLSSCKFCDEIAVFHEGAVIQQGSHEDLLADADGKYCELWHAQAQYYAN